MFLLSQTLKLALACRRTPGSQHACERGGVAAEFGTGRSIRADPRDGRQQAPDRLLCPGQ